MKTIKLELFRETNINNKLIAFVNRTYAIIIPEKEFIKDVIMPTGTVKGIYEFIYNKDFKLMFGENVNLCLKISDRDFYGYINNSDLIKLMYFNKRLWIQQKDNMLWLLGLFTSLLTITVAIILILNNCNK